MKRADIKSRILKLKVLAESINGHPEYIMEYAGLSHKLSTLKSSLSDIENIVNKFKKDAKLWARYYNAWYKRLYKISQQNESR